ncbi:MAG: hypothetical protein QOI34_1734 [Verrucomicrobiota bacterium]
MAHDVFISHSSQDKPVADAACAALEGTNIRCWIAPRDVQPGRTFAGEINRAIQHSKVLVLIFSANSNKSEQVLREVQLASNSHLHIVQFRIQDVIPNDDLEYYLSAPHWLDALLPPLENHLERLKGSVKALLQLDAPAEPFPGADPTAEKGGPSPAASKVEERVRPRPPHDGIPPKRTNVWMPLLVAAVVLCAILLGLLFFQLSKRPKGEAQSQITGTSPPAAAKSPDHPAATPGYLREGTPVRSAKGPRLFIHNFETASPIIRPLFGPNIMSVLNANGEGQITGRAPGVLPAMFDRFLLDDFIVGCSMRAENVPPGARYGFIFRAADVRNGGIARYYALLLDPNQGVVAMNCWMDDKWTMKADQPVPPGMLQVGRTSRINVEALDNRFRVFIDEHFATEFHADGLKDGRIGLCLAGVDKQAWTVHFENFQIFLTPGKAQSSAGSAATSSVSGKSNKAFQQSWDFSAGMLADIRSDRVELVDAKTWNLPGGKHARFVTGGMSWLEATFDLPDDADPPTHMTVRHLSSGADGGKPGFSPVQITLNGTEIFHGSPAEQGWMDQEIDLGHTVRPGTNTLRWEFLHGAQTHYWLKSFRVTGPKR